MSDREREADDAPSAASTADDDRPPRQSVADQDRPPGVAEPDAAGESAGNQPGDGPESDGDGSERPPPPPIDREHPAPENVVFFLLGVLVAVATLAQLLGGAI